MRPVYVNGFALLKQPNWRERCPFLADVRKLNQKYLFFHDRSGYFPNEINAKTLHPIPPALPAPTPFPDLLQHLIDRLILRCLDQNRRLYVCYSGGIDSTAIMCAILRSDHVRHIRKALHVGMTANSITENPQFYYDYVSKNALIDVLDYGKMADPSFLLTGGEYGDQLVGSLVIDEVDHTKPWRDTIDLFIGQRNFSQQSIDRFMGFADTAPVPIRTTLHFWWWFDFCCKWQEIYFRGYRWFEANLTEQQLDQGHYYPFGSVEFQQWSMAHMRELQPPPDYRMVKAPMLEFVHEFDKNDDFFHNKRKFRSQKRLNRLVHKHIVWEDFSSTDSIHTALECFNEA